MSRSALPAPDGTGSQRPTDHRLKTLRWLLLNLALPYLGVWLIVFVPTRNIAASFLVSALVFPVLSPFALFSFYRGRLLSVHPFLRFSKVAVCPLCSERIERNRFTKHLSLIPYGFKSLRHYEAVHPELAKDARRARLSLTLFVDYIMVMVGILLGFSNITNPRNQQLSQLETLGAFLLPFFVLELILWTLLRYVLISKKGAIFDG